MPVLEILYFCKQKDGFQAKLIATIPKSRTDPLRIATFVANGIALLCLWMMKKYVQ
jgi:hypothetical protein